MQKMQSRRKWLKSIGLGGASLAVLSKFGFVKVNNPVTKVDNPVVKVDNPVAKVDNLPSSDYFNVMGVDQELIYGQTLCSWKLVSNGHHLRGLTPPAGLAYYMNEYNIHQCVIARDPEHPDIQKLVDMFSSRLTLCRFRDQLNPIDGTLRSITANEQVWKKVCRVDSYFDIALDLARMKESLRVK